MRKSAKALLLVLVAILGSGLLALTSAFSAAFAYGAAIALIVPGTGTHDIGSIPEYKQNAVTRYIDPAGTTICADATTCQIGIDYPASFFPLVIFPGWCPNLKCDTWNKSVGTGVENLDKKFYETYDPNDPNQQIVIFGYSQGGAVVSQEMYKLINDPNVDKSRVSVVTIGNINNPLGLWSRLSFLPTIPILDISFGPQLPTSGIKSTNYSFEYDPVGDAPQYWGNPLTMLNALAAFEYVHGYYLSPNENGESDTLPYGYNNATLAYAIAHTDHRQYQDATFVLIPQQGALPIFQPFVDLATATGTRGLVDPVISLIQPVTKVLINLGYDRNANPGIPRTLSILPFDPFQNWFGVGADLVNAAGEGVTNVVDGVDVTKPPTTPPTTVTTQSTSGSPFVPLDTSTPAPPTTVDEPQQNSTLLTTTSSPTTTNKTPVVKLKDVTSNKPVSSVLKGAADAVKSTVNGVKGAVDSVTHALTGTTKATNNDTSSDKNESDNKSANKDAA